MSSKLIRILLGLPSVLATVMAASLVSTEARALGTCTVAHSVEVCVASASLVGGSVGYGGRPVTVSVSLRIVNKSDFPVGIALLDKGWSSWSFTPQDAEAIMNRGSWNVAGVPTCQEFQIADHSCAFASLGSGASALAQIRYDSSVEPSGLQLVQIASKASFAASLLLDVRGSTSQIALDLSDVPFGNALSSISR